MQLLYANVQRRFHSIMTWFVRVAHLGANCRSTRRTGAQRQLSEEATEAVLHHDTNAIPVGISMLRFKRCYR
jgi:hypothetical protein